MPAGTGYDRKDALYRRAKREGYRSRAAYKLEELQRAHAILRAGQRVADLGCWPGGWLQMAAQQVGPSGRVVGVDLAAIEPPLENANAISFIGDLTEPVVAERILAELGAEADVVLSDAAPKLTGVRATDRAREEVLLAAVEALVPRLLRRGGTLVVKLLDSPEAEAVVGRLRKRFGSLKTARLRATRQGSAERYLLARDFRA